MIVLIYVKWWFVVNPYDALPDVDPTTAGPQPNISTSPSIINLLIGDVMGLTGFADKNEPMYQWFDSQ